jgi:hypothetical protein
MCSVIHSPHDRPRRFANLGVVWTSGEFEKEMLYAHGLAEFLRSSFKRNIAKLWPFALDSSQN